MTDVKAIATAYIEAVGDGRLDELHEYLREDVVFDGAGVKASAGLDEYLAALRRLAPIIERNELRSVVTDGDRVCVLYDFVTSTPAGAVTSAEWLTFEDGKIASVYLLFDKARWPEVLQHLQALAAA